MELLQLRYFSEVARFEHMTKAARQLHIAQPALTQSIHRLEAELGVSLFERKGRGIRLTPEGRYLQQQVEPILARVDGLEEGLRAFLGERRATVRVDIRAASNLTLDLILAYRKEHPQTGFRFVQMGDYGEADISVDCLDPSEGRGVPAENRFLLTEPICLAVPADSAFGDTVPIEALQGQGIVRLSGQRRLSDICDELCARHGVRTHVAFETDNPLVVQRVIQQGMGIGFWPKLTWPKIDGPLARLAVIDAPDFQRTISVTRDGHVRPGDAADSFFSFCSNRMSALSRGEVLLD